MRRRIFMALVVSSMLSLVPLLCGQPGASAADYPTKPISIMVGQAAGGSTDLGARVFASLLEKEFGQPVIVVNKPGGSQQVASNELIRLPADGHNLLFVNFPALNTVILQASRKAPFDLDDFEFIANQVKDQGVIVVKPGGPYKDCKDLIEDTKKRSGQVRIGLQGILTHSHFGALLLEREAGVKVRVVQQFEGSGAVAAAVMGGHIDAGIDRVGSYATKVQAGDLKAIAVLDTERSEFLPGVPSTTELGYPKWKTASSAGLLAKKGTPAPIVKKLEAAALKIMNDPEHVKKMTTMGQRLGIMGGAEYRKYAEEWHRVTKEMMDLFATKPK
jgi:tripartite-type tricarboxylate transporter receptor subunit TctC